MKKRLVLGLMALSLASGAIVFGRSAENQPFEESLELCPDECCRAGGSEESPSCCKDTEMCCE